MQSYRFAPSAWWLSHVWKCAVLSPHREWRATLANLVPQDGTVIDVGAHGGQFTRLFARTVPRGLVVAVEPSSYTRSVLRMVLWLARVRNVVVFAAGLGAESGAAVLRTPIKRHGQMGYGLATLDGSGTARSVAEPVPVATLDALVDALGLMAIHFINVDIEGHEAAMVAGGRETLRRFRPAVLLEQDPNFLARAGSSIEALSAEMVALGYAPHRRSRDDAHPRIAEGESLEGDILWLPSGLRVSTSVSE